MSDHASYQPPQVVFGYPAWPGTPSADLLITGMREFLKSKGVVSASYRHVSRFHSQLDDSANLHHFGFPAAWVRLYDHDPKFREHDPIADFILAAGSFMTWRQAIGAQSLDPEQQAFVEAMEQHGLVDGIALPLYGPRGKEAYATYSFGREINADDLETVLMLNDFFWLRHAEIAIAEDEAWIRDRALSPRETEVLYWIAQGKSNHDIAIILHVKLPTVAEYVKRLFAKLEVRTRMEAASAGLQRGIINLSATD